MAPLVVDGDGDTLALHGEFDMAQAAAFERDVVDRVRVGALSGDITLDLADLTFVDSSAIRCLLQLAKMLAPRSLRLLDPQPIVWTVLRLTSIDDYPNIELITSEG